jgi:hypothetical protein
MIHGPCYLPSIPIAIGFMQVHLEGTEAKNLLKCGRMCRTSVDGYLANVAKDTSRSAYKFFRRA